MHKHKVCIFIILLFVTILNLSLFINKHLAIYTYPVNPAFLEKLYGQSQYVRVDPISMLPDETIYAHAAWRYINGGNPAIFNADQPPLGKYFIGLSEKYFNNERITGPVFNILCLVALFFLANEILRNKLWAMALVTIFSFEKLFMVQMLYAPLLDNIQLFFIILSFIFYILWIKNKFSPISLFLSLGLVMATKFWITGAIIYLVWLTHILLTKRLKKILSFLIFTPLFLITMILSYLPSLLQGDSLRNFFGVQRYIFEFHKAKLNLDPIAIWDLLLFNRWHVPWEGTIKVSSDWQWTWPLITIFTAIAVIKIIRSRSKDSNLSSNLGVLVVWSLVYFILLSISTVIPRYLFPVMPIMYIMSFWIVKESWDSKKNVLQKILK